MNILLFVFSMLMILSIMTTARLNSFLDTSEVRHSYLYYMKEEERELIRKRAASLYDQHTVSSGEESGSRSRLNGRLDFSIFLTPSPNENERFQTYYQAGTRLLDLLSREEGMGERLLSRMMEVVEEPIKSEDQLKKLDLQLAQSDPMRHVYCRMLAGFYECTEPLTKYVHLSAGGKKGELSLYLAQPELLQAILEDSGRVRQIEQTRNEIYANFRNDDDYRQAMSEELKQLVADSWFYPYFDFRVSGSRPPRSPAN